MPVFLYGDILGASAVVGACEVLEKTSSGGFATVYRGRHLTTGAAVALKVLYRALCDDARMIARFHREAEAIRRIDHPRVVTLIDHGELNDGRPYLAMEWLAGRTLDAELADRGILSVAEARAVLADVGDAVTAAHAAGVIHRDLKAENIMAVPRRGGWFSSHLIDFGIARFLPRPGDEADDTDLSSFVSQSTVGTPTTMAPEQITGAPADQRTDVYAMGGLLFQLLTGRLPFLGRDPVELEQMHLYAPPPHAAELAPVSPAVDQVIQRALAKDQDRRHASAKAMLAALDAAVGVATGTGRMATVTLPAEPTLGLYLEFAVTDDSDAAADALGDIMDAAHEGLAAAGFEVIAAVANALWAIAPDSGDRDASQERRRTAVDMLLALDNPDRAPIDQRLVQICALACRYARTPTPCTADFGPERLPDASAGVWADEAMLRSIARHYICPDQPAERDALVRVAGTRAESGLL